MPEGATLPGRSGIDALFTDCIRRPAEGSTGDLPVIVLLGMRGSGKTWVLEYLKGRCEGSDAIPYVFADCAAQPDNSVWQLSCELADALHAERWPGFGRLNFPRVTLARLAVEHLKLDENLAPAQEALRKKLRAPFVQHVDPVVGLVTNLLSALSIPQWMISAVVWSIRFIAGSNRTVERLYRRGLKWYGVKFGRSANSGLSFLVELNRRYHRDDQRKLAESVLLEAFIDDLKDAFTRRRDFNCAIFLDNCDDSAGTGFLNLLAELRSRDSDPLVVMAASRTRPDLIGLDSSWSLPWEPDQPGKLRVPNPNKTSYTSRHDDRVGTSLASSWYPVHLRDLTGDELRQDYKLRRLYHPDFVYRFAAGHPWSAHRVHKLGASGALANTLSETELLNIPAKFARQEAAEYLLADLPTTFRPTLVQWSAARDIGVAAAALGDGGGDLQSELEKRLWLVPGDPRLHPWLRRILLRELAEDAERWSQVHRRLCDYAAQQGRLIDAAYHELACGELPPVVDHLVKQLGWMDADSWIQEFDAVTDAPSRASGETPVKRHERLVFERGPLDDGPLDQNARVHNILWSLVAARWIWSDQLGDPKVSLKDTIADGYARLADESRAGSARYRREARVYREMRPW